jgi:prepilin-type N-terminal cleavage/methylation domain-containing protein
MRDEEGFTLIELLVTMSIIAILAAIGLAMLGQQRAKASDAEAKQRVSNLVHLLEACNVDRDDFRDCSTAADLQPLGFRVGTDPGDVEIRLPTKRTYTAVAYSTTGSEFRIERAANGSFRSCTPPGEGGCHAGADW